MAESATIYLPGGVDYGVVDEVIREWARTVIGQVGWGIDDEDPDDYNEGFGVALDVKTRALTTEQLEAGLEQVATELAERLGVRTGTSFEFDRIRTAARNAARSTA